MMKKVACGDNPYVVKMVGCVSAQKPYALVLEYVPYGSLLDYLRENRKLVRYCDAFVSSCMSVSVDLCNMWQSFPNCGQFASTLPLLCDRSCVCSMYSRYTYIHTYVHNVVCAGLGSDWTIAVLNNGSKFLRHHRVYVQCATCYRLYMH